jgi:hypothetical protein
VASLRAPLLSASLFEAPPRRQGIEPQIPTFFLAKCEFFLISALLLCAHNDSEGASGGGADQWPPNFGSRRSEAARTPFWKSSVCMRRGLLGLLTLGRRADAISEIT